MANPKNLDLPLGWGGLSPKLPNALARTYSKYARIETPSEGRYDLVGPVFRGDASSLMLVAVPHLRKLARWPKPMAGGDVKETE